MVPCAHPRRPAKQGVVDDRSVHAVDQRRAIRAQHHHGAGQVVAVEGGDLRRKGGARVRAREDTAALPPLPGERRCRSPAALSATLQCGACAMQVLPDLLKVLSTRGEQEHLQLARHRLKRAAGGYEVAPPVKEEPQGCVNGKRAGGEPPARAQT